MEPVPSVDPWSNLLREVTLLSNQLRRSAMYDEPSSLLAAPEGRLLHCFRQFGPQTVPQIARANTTSRQNVQIQVNRLTAGGWLELTGNPAHRRSALVCLTRQGRAALASTTDKDSKFIEALRSRFPDFDPRATTALLQQIREQLSEPRPGGDVAVSDRESESRRVASPRQKTTPRTNVPDVVGPKDSARAAELRQPIREVEEPAELPVNLL